MPKYRNLYDNSLKSLSYVTHKLDTFVETQIMKKDGVSERIFDVFLHGGGVTALPRYFLVSHL